MELAGWWLLSRALWLVAPIAFMVAVGWKAVLGSVVLLAIVALAIEGGVAQCKEMDRHGN